MKKLLSTIIFLILLLSILSCEKDSNITVEKRLYLSKVIFDGKLNMEFSYDSIKRVIETYNYNNSGAVISKSTFEYCNNQLCIERIMYKGNVLYTRTFVFDLKNNLTRLNFCLADTSIVTNHVNYFYNEKNMCSREEHYYGDSLFYTVQYEYPGENKTASSYYINDSLVATINNTYDGKMNPEKYVSSLPYLLNQHNLLSATSPGNTSGVVWLQLEATFSVSYALGECSYEYNEFNYPVKKIYTPASPYHSVQVSEFEYIE